MLWEEIKIAWSSLGARTLNQTRSCVDLGETSARGRSADCAVDRLTRDALFAAIKALAKDSLGLCSALALLDGGHAPRARQGYIAAAQIDLRKEAPKVRHCVAGRILFEQFERVWTNEKRSRKPERVWTVEGYYVRVLEHEELKKELVLVAIKLSI